MEIIIVATIMFLILFYIYKDSEYRIEVLKRQLKEWKDQESKK
jgi:hypothetical protein